MMVEHETDTPDKDDKGEDRVDDDPLETRSSDTMEADASLSKSKGKDEPRDEKEDDASEPGDSEKEDAKPADTDKKTSQGGPVFKVAKQDTKRYLAIQHEKT